MGRTCIALLVLAWTGGLAHAEGPRLVLNANGEPLDVRAFGSLKAGWSLDLRVAFSFADTDPADIVTAALKRGAARLASVKCKRTSTARYVVSLKEAAKDTPVTVYSCRVKGVKKDGNVTATIEYKAAKSNKTYKKAAQLAFDIAKTSSHYYSRPDNLVGPVFYQLDVEGARSGTPKMWLWTRVKLAPAKKADRRWTVKCTDANGTSWLSKDWRTTGRSSIAGAYELWEPAVQGPLPATGNHTCTWSTEGNQIRRWEFRVSDAGSIADACGDALGLDSSSGTFATRAQGDLNWTAAAAKRGLYFQASVPDSCKNILQ